MSETTAPPVERYRLGQEQIDRFTVRDRIRNGEIDSNTELALVGSDEWKPAASYPELVRYFELAAVRPVTSGGYVAAPARTVEPMGARVAGGLLYPVENGAFVTILAIAAFSVLPVVGLLATLGTTVMMLSIVNRSADGKTKAPAFVDFSDVGFLIGLWLRVIAVTLISLAPLYLAIGFVVTGFFTHTISLALAVFIVLAAAAFGAIYYPACLATVAVWHNVLASLNPFYVYRVIRTIGGDYFIVIAIWFTATAATMIMNFFSPLKYVPFVGSFVSSCLSLYVLFYASHLLGYAVYRHAPELGWE